MKVKTQIKNNKAYSSKHRTEKQCNIYVYGKNVQNCAFLNTTETKTKFHKIKTENRKTNV